MKSLLEKNAIEIYSTQNEEKFAIAERFIRTFNIDKAKFIDT